MESNKVRMREIKEENVKNGKTNKRLKELMIMISIFVRLVDINFVRLLVIKVYINKR